MTANATNKHKEAVMIPLAQNLNTLSARELAPFTSEAKAIEAANQYVDGKITDAQKQQLFRRLSITSAHAQKFIPILVKRLHSGDVEARHRLLDYFSTLVGRRIDLSVIADDIARQLAHANYPLREKAASVLIAMREAAEVTIPRLFGFLRAKISNVQAFAVEILAAIGPSCAETTLPKIEQLLTFSISKEVRAAAERARKIIKGLEPYVEKDAVESIYPALVRKTILIIDSDNSIYLPMNEVCLEHKIILEYARDYRQFRSYVEKEYYFDIIGVGAKFADCTGVEVIGCIRNMEQYRTTPIGIALDELNATEMLRYAKLNVATFFKKPMTFHEVLKRFNEIMIMVSE